MGAFHCEGSTVLWASSTCKNEPAGEDLCVRHVFGKGQKSGIVGQGFLCGIGFV